RCSELYRTWIKRHVRRAEDRVIVADVDGQIAGYSACPSPERNTGVISLLAVADAYRHRGIGLDLVNASLDWFAQGGAEIVSTTTQGWNIAAQRVYQRCGFRTGIVDLYYHKWFNVDGSREEDE